MPQSVTFDLDDETLAALDRLAARTECSREHLIGQVVHDYLDLRAWQADKIAAGIRAAENGDFVGDDEIARIVEKYATAK